MVTPTPAPQESYRICVLLVDDQAMIGEAVRRMLAAEADIEFHYCQKPEKALETANTVKPTIILQDLVMPEIDGLTLVKFFRRNPSTRDIPLVVLSTKEDPKIKAEAFSLGANDYLVKLPDKLELVARIRYHSRGFIAKLQRDDAYARLEQDVAQAAKYVRSLLPDKLTGKVTTDWRLIATDALGGDAFGYYWLDADHFACYLLDVCGHGVGAALLSISALNVLRAQTLRECDFRDPGQVLTALNKTFQMEEHNDMYFTIWYGVFNPATRALRFAAGGHPPALLITNPDGPNPTITELEENGPMIGAVDGLTFRSRQVDVPPGARLFIFSDGVYEIDRGSEGMWKFSEFCSFMAAPPPPGENPIDHLFKHVQAMSGNKLADDFTMVQADL